MRDELTPGGPGIGHPGFFDVFAWREPGQVRFYEVKVGPDRIKPTQLRFVELALRLLLDVVLPGGQPVLPFPTRLVADALHDVEAERVAVTIYGLTLLTIRLLGSALDAYARREHLYSQHEDGEELYEQRSLLPVVIGYVTAILVGLPLPKVAVALYFGIAVYLVVPFGEVRRLLFRRS